MRRLGTTVVTLSLTLGVLLVGAVSAAKFNKKLDIGQKAPEFAGLEGVDGQKHSLADFANSKVVVLVFTGNECPVAQSYEQRFIEFQKKYAEQGVSLIAINVEGHSSVDPLKQHADERAFNFPYLLDSNQESGKAFGATVTPHLFVLDQERKVAYMGAFDDNFILSEVKHNYLLDAVDALLTGQQPEVTETRAKGCAIQYR
jgi:peroxiredoxin